jgi:hypothetical protein
LTLAVPSLDGARDCRYIIALGGHICGRFRFVQEIPDLAHHFPRPLLVQF